MALIKPQQLRSGIYEITGSFSGSFQGDGSGLINLPIGSRITFNSTTASVDSPNNLFLITSASSEIFKVDNVGSMILNSQSPTPFLIKNNLNEDILLLKSDGVLTLTTQSIELLNPAPHGGIYFTSSSLFVGLE